jgi:hypothetical protein
MWRYVTMRRIVVSLIAGLLLIVALAVPSAAAVDCESGHMFAHEHVVPGAHAGMFGGDMNPGMHHGYSICVP